MVQPLRFSLRREWVVAVRPAAQEVPEGSLPGTAEPAVSTTQG